MMWTLKPEWKDESFAEVKNEEAPDSVIDGETDVAGDGDDAVSNSDDEDNEGMEDVLPS